jgi:hypothetical protein
MLVAKKYFVWTWILALFIATAGISVEQIYCYCLGKTSIAFFRSDAACQAKKRTDTANCCKKKVRACCEQKEAGSSKDHGCTHKTVKVFQLKTAFIVDQSIEKGQVLADLPSLDAPTFVFSAPTNLPLAPDVVAFPPSPPLPSGRELCIWHHQFLC